MERWAWGGGKPLWGVGGDARSLLILNISPPNTHVKYLFTTTNHTILKKISLKNLIKDPFTTTIATNVWKGGHLENMQYLRDARRLLR